MRLVLISFGIFMTLVFTSSLWAGDAPDGVGARITLVSSSDAPGQITHDRLARVYWELIRGQKLESKTTPKVVVLHVSKEEAANAGMARSGVNFDNFGDYQIWLVGKPEPNIYVRGFETVLRHAFQLPKKTPPEFLALMRHLIEFESSSVDVKSLMEEK